MIQVSYKVDDNSLLAKHFGNKEHMLGLIKLYQSSNLECSRNSRLSPEVGNSREKDLIASLKSNPQLTVNYDVHNYCKQDVFLNKKGISIKHSSNKRVSSSGVKVVWTSNENKQALFVSSYDFDHDMLFI